MDAGAMSLPVLLLIYFWLNPSSPLCEGHKGFLAQKLTHCLAAFYLVTLLPQDTKHQDDRCLSEVQVERQEGSVR